MDTNLRLTLAFQASILEINQCANVSRGEFFCMGERQTKKPGTRHSLSFVFVNTDEGYKRPHMFLQPEPWSLRCKKCVQYHTIQLRWDTERRLARHFNRRQGGSCTDSTVL